MLITLILPLECCTPTHINRYLLMLTSLACCSTMCTEVAFCQALLHKYMI